MVIHHWQIQHTHAQMANPSSQHNMFASSLWLESAHGWPDGLEEVSMKAWRPTGFCVLVSLIYLTRFSTALWYRVWCCFHKIHVLVLVPLILDPTRVATFYLGMISVPSKWLRPMPCKLHKSQLSRERWKTPSDSPRKVGRRNLASTNAFASFSPHRKSMTVMLFSCLKWGKDCASTCNLIRWYAFQLQLFAFRHFLQENLLLELNDRICIWTMREDCRMHVCCEDVRGHWGYASQMPMDLLAAHINPLVLGCVASPRRPAHFSAAPPTLQVCVCVPCEGVQWNRLN